MSMDSSPGRSDMGKTRTSSSPSMVKPPARSADRAALGSRASTWTNPSTSVRPSMFTPERLSVSTTLASSPGRSAVSRTARSRPIGSQLYLGGLRQRSGSPLPEQGKDFHYAATSPGAERANLLDHINLAEGDPKTRGFSGGPPSASGGSQRSRRQLWHLRLDHPGR